MSRGPCGAVCHKASCPHGACSHMQALTDVSHKSVGAHVAGAAGEGPDAVRTAVTGTKPLLMTIAELLLTENLPWAGGAGCFSFTVPYADSGLGG